MGILHASNTLAGVTVNSVAATTITSLSNIGDVDYQTGSLNWAVTGFRPSSANGFQEIDIASAQTQFWVAFNHYTLPSTGNTGHMFTCKVNGGSDAISLYCNNNIPELRHWNGSAWIVLSGQVSTRHNLGVAGGVANASLTSARYDIDIKIHSSAGWINVYRGNILILSYSGNTVFNGVTSVNQFRFHHGFTSHTTVSEFLISTNRTIGLRNYSATINGAGASTTFTSGTFTAVDEEDVISSTVDADFALSATADQILGLALDSLLNSLFKIYAVVINFRALNIAGAPESANAFIRVASTNYHGTDSTLLTSYEGRKHVWETNPNTLVDWVAADIPALEAGVRSRT